MDITKVLPEECLSLIVSLTSPRDACRSSLVSRSFQLAADSDAVWDRFLPSDWLQNVSDSSSVQELSSLSSKQVFLRLCGNPVLVNNGTLLFSLGKESGKKQYVIGARRLAISWGDTPAYWFWKSLPESRFPEVAELRFVWWFQVKGKIEGKLLSPNTSYAAYLVFKLRNSTEYLERKVGFERTVEVSIGYEGTVGEQKRNVLLDPSTKRKRMKVQKDITSHLPRDRGDGWMEIEIGRIFNGDGDDGNVVFYVQELNGHIKAGLIVEGIEFRPEDSR
ncbi:hypothetical protein Tsubulata_045135 [Turnera subulata]|uniref:F-box domain-containing protein n=1 Tax=Turnera subulata TaxID=218843 RepID=A0A9Q0F4C5_9ROSI|nr:hypothetical protein Tsubulata_045135 [Turnera subulata]